MFSDFGYSEEGKLGKAYDWGLLKQLYPFARPYRGTILLAVILAVLITVVELGMPYVTKIAIDRHIVPETSAQNESAQVRYLEIEITDPEADRLVQKYSGLFKITQHSARIRWDDLNRLERSDLRILRKKDFHGIALAAAVYLGLVLLSFGFNFLQVMVMEYAGQRIMHDLRMRLFSHVQSLSVSFFNRTPVARLVTRTTNDIENMHELFTSVIVFLFRDLFLFIGIGVVMVNIHWPLALICFSILPLVALASLFFARMARDVFRILRIKTAEINTRFSETISGMKVIQLFRQEAANYQSFKALNHEFYQAGMRQIHIFAVFMPLIELLSAAALALVIFYGGRGVLSSDISLGILVAFISYMRMFFSPIRDLSEKYNILQNAMSSAERIFFLLNTREQETRPAPEASVRIVQGGEPKPIEKIQHVAFRQVSFEYVKGEPVLKSVSFELPAGKTFAVVGPTGSGKTSLINLLIRFYQPSTGQIFINDRDLSEWDLESLRSRMALVTQDPFLFSESVAENIFQGRGRVSDETASRILETARCQGIIERLPQGIHTRLAEGGSSISSGERQLISIARAFARDPDLIILDEATSYIDSQTEARVQEALANLMKGRTSIVVAHRLSTIRSADHIMALNHGRIIEAGTHAELMARQGFYFRLNQL